MHGMLAGKRPADRGTGAVYARGGAVARDTPVSRRPNGLPSQPSGCLACGRRGTEGGWPRPPYSTLWTRFPVSRTEPEPERHLAGRHEVEVIAHLVDIGSASHWPALSDAASGTGSVHTWQL